jgi:hypothetical protein
LPLAEYSRQRRESLQRFYAQLQAQIDELAKVATARKLGIRLYIMLRDQIDYAEFFHSGLGRQKHGGAHAGMPERKHDPAFSGDRRLE